MEISEKYQLGTLLYSSPQSLVYRASRISDALPVVVKILNREFPSPEEIVRFKYEYDLCTSSSEGMQNAIDYISYKNSKAIIFIDIEGDSLEKIFKDKIENLRDFILLAKAIATNLAEIHKRKVIHKDINPKNIIFNPSKNILQIIDFGISTTLSHENIEPGSTNSLEGTLGYISPEQTGRMNRVIDYRTDFYSLGATLYKLFTGSPPFDCESPAELIHAHIAKPPSWPTDLIGKTPYPVQKIILKLLSKNSEDRYQTTRGILLDLDKCLSFLNQEKEIEFFEPGENDASPIFSIPQKLFGREAEIRSMLDHFEQASGGTSSLLVVSGYSGVGKTALINELQKPLSAKDGYFLTGKFDQYQKSTPYFAFIQTFKDLVRKISKEPKEKIAYWKNAISASIGSNFKLIHELVPESGWLSDGSAINPISQMKTDDVFVGFLNSFLDHNKSLVIFLDDLQWADAASLDFIEHLVSKEKINGLMLIISYRDNEVSEAHPLMLMLNKIKKQNVSVNHIVLKPINHEAVESLLSDTLLTVAEEVAPLATVVYKKTLGNPFFIGQLLKSLNKHNLIYFDSDSAKWRWSLEDVGSVSSSENVVDILTEKISEFGEEVKDLLKKSACLGNSFNLLTLADISGVAPFEIAKLFVSVVDEGLLIPSSNSYRFLHESSSGEDVEYRFLHDRIQQAAYSTMKEEQRVHIHSLIGKKLLQSCDQISLKSRIFEIVGHLNLSSKLVEKKSDHVEMAKLNLMAGQKAQISSAFQAADEYYKISFSHLGKSTWREEPELHTELFVHAAEAAYLNGDFSRMEGLVSTAIENITDPIIKSRVYQVRVSAFIAQNDAAGAVYASLPALEILGFPVPKSPSKVFVLSQFLKSKWLLRKGHVYDLSDLPAMSDPPAAAAIRICTVAANSAYVLGNSLSFLLNLKTLLITLRHGNAPESAFAYAVYGVLRVLSNDTDIGYQFGQLGLKLLERDKSAQLKASVHFVAHAFTSHWREPLAKNFPALLDGYRSGMDSGDLQYGCLCAFIYCYHSFCHGYDLRLLEKEIGAYSKVIEEKNQKATLWTNRMFEQMTINLQGKSTDPKRLIGEAYNEETMLAEHKKARDFIGCFCLHFNKMYLYYLFGDYEQAFESSIQCKKYITGATAAYALALFYFYRTLVRLALFNANLSLKDRKKSRGQIDFSLKKLKDWALLGSNHENKYKLALAEFSRVNGKLDEAISLYDEAIMLARKHDFQHEEALANELAGRFWVNKNNDIAKMYLERAKHCYTVWGAYAKVTQMGSFYDGILSDSCETSIVPASAQSSIESTQSATYSSSRTSSFDLQFVVNAYSVITAEVKLQSLLEKIMSLVMENSGAQRALLLFSQSEGWVVEASSTVDPTALESKDEGSLSSMSYPIDIVNMVSRTYDPIVLNDAFNDINHSASKYISEKKCRSILCTPLLRQGKLIGILYLENNISTGAFTRNRVEIVDMLAAQAAVSIDNSRLYENLESAVEERTADLEAANNEILSAYNKAEDLRQRAEVARSQAEVSQFQATQALEELKATQTQLIAAEKMASLGLLVSNVAHEINTPIGAVKSSGALIADTLDTALPELSKLFALLDEHNRALFVQLISQCKQFTAKFSTRDERALTKQLTTQLQEAGIEEASRNARLLMKLRAHTNPLEYLPLLQHPESEFIGAVAGNIADIINGTNNINSAVEKVSRVVYALKALSGDDVVKAPIVAPLQPDMDKALAKYQSQMHSVELAKDFQADMPAIHADHDAMEQLCIHLVMNALQAMNYTGKLSVGLKAENNQAIISVTDTGTGIADDIKDRIFEPFFSTRLSGEGSGMGLAIVKRIVEQHQGSINLQTEVGVGTTFTVSLPFTA